MTTRASPLHRWAGFDGRIWPRAVVIYVTTVVLTYGAMFTAALASHVLVATTPGLKLPFLQDWNIAFTFLVSVPIIVLLLVSDQHVLQSALHRIQDSGVVVLPAQRAHAIARKWSDLFRRDNLYAQILILVASALASALTLRLYVVTDAGFWAAPDGHLRLVGVVYCYCITVLYFVIAFYCFRCIRHAYFLRDLVRQATINVRPFHQDGCGGLQPIGAVALRNQYTLTVLGLNIVCVAAVNYTSLATPDAERQIMILVGIAVLLYLALGPVVFMAPLLPFRARMRETKLQLLEEVGDRLRTEFERVRASLRTQAISEPDLEILERLKKLMTMVEQVPVWPFDARTLRRFGSAYVLPVVIPMATKVATTFLV